MPKVMVRRSVAPPEGGIFDGQVSQTLSMNQNITASFHNPVAASTLNPAVNMDYNGVTIDVPTSGEFTYANGAFAIRPNGGGAGVPTVFLMGCPNGVGGGNDSIYECTFPTSGGACTVIKNHGTYLGIAATETVGAVIVCRGLLWVEEQGRLYITYGISYSASNTLDPSIVTMEPNAGETPSVFRGPFAVAGEDFLTTRHGFWTTRSMGMMTLIPAAERANFDNCAIMFSSQTRSGNQQFPYGPSCSAIPLIPDDAPVAAATPDATVSVRAIQIVEYLHDSGTHRKSKPADTKVCGWTYYNGDHESGLWTDIYGVNGGVPRDLNAEGKLPQSNMVQDGSGCNVDGQYCGVYLTDADPWWTDLDMMGGMAFVYGDLKQGLVQLGQVCRTIAGMEAYYPWDGFNHKSYTPVNTPFNRGQCPHGQVDNFYNAGSTGDITNTQMRTMFVFGLEQLVDIYAGGDPYDQEPDYDHVDIGNTIPGMNSGMSLATKIYDIGGMCVDPERECLWFTIYADRLDVPYQQLPRFYRVDLPGVWS